ncbi:MAG TPA: glycosyltransferase, partial [Spirochaetia bacterium]|nr:glycosyltransferase [Spirochaetia bacterium]
MIFELLSIGALVLAVAGWIAGWLSFFRSHRLPAAASGAPEAASVSVIIPARNEEARLGPLLASLDRQTVTPLEIIVVDDDSNDNTRQLAQKAGVTVVVAPARPAGWLGKPWACHCGAGRARGDILLFLDADVRLAPDALARLLTASLRERGLISVQPWH